MRRRCFPAQIQLNVSPFPCGGKLWNSGDEHRTNTICKPSTCMALGESPLMKRNVRFVFILGFEKAGTTALADHLVVGEFCRYLVPGTKEPRLLAFAPDVLARLMQEHAEADFEELWLESSVDNILQLDQLREIAGSGGEFRVIVCLRNQLERTISAYRFYRDINGRKLDAESMARIGERVKLESRGEHVRLVNGDKAPEYLRRPLPLGHYFHSAWNHQAAPDAEWAALLEAFDLEVAGVLSRSFLRQLQHEIATYRSEHCFPKCNVLNFSYYTYHLTRLFETVAPEKIMIISSRGFKDSAALNAALVRFLEPRNATPETLVPERLNETEGAAISKVEREGARRILHDSFVQDTQSTTALLERYPQANLELFDPTDLYAGPAPDQVQPRASGPSSGTLTNGD